MQPDEEGIVTWWAVDDQFLDNPKTERLYEMLLDDEDTLHCAIHVWLCAGVHSARNLTDGLVREAKLRGLAQASQERFDAAMQALEAVGLLTRANGAAQMHDWEQCNPTREQVLARRERDAARKRGENPNRISSSERTPRGVQTESVRTPNAPLPSPPLPISHSPARTREEQAPSQSDPERAALLGALRSHKVLAELGHERLVDGIMAHRVALPGNRLEWYIHAIAEAVGSIHDDQASGSWLTENDKAKRVGAFCRRAKAPPAPVAATQAPRGAPYDPEADRRAANERARAAKAAQERSAKPADPTPEERKANAASAKAARTALSAVGNGGIPRRAVQSAQAPLPAIRSSDEVDAEAAERSRADRARLEAWEAEEHRKAVAT